MPGNQVPPSGTGKADLPAIDDGSTVQMDKHLISLGVDHQVVHLAAETAAVPPLEGDQLTSPAYSMCCRKKGKEISGTGSTEEVRR